MTTASEPTRLPARDPRPVAAALVDEVSRAVRGRTDTVRLALSALLGGGHLLLEGAPGTGKTLLAKSLAVAVGGRFARIQGTPDLLPADLTGTTVYSPATGLFEFRPGPVFADVVLVDELNRASPRTQAALLEPMEEHQVSVDGTTHRLPDPHFVIATQNPHGWAGTFPLPESQLDRFLVCTEVGLTDRASEREILAGSGGVGALAEVVPVTDPAGLRAVIRATATTHCDPAVVEYLLDLMDAARSHPDVVLGPSTRASLALLAAARGHAVLSGRDHVAPDDVQAVTVPVLAHRLVLAGGVDVPAAGRLLGTLLERVAVPRP